MPVVSVIVPTYNSARYLSQALDSVLSQTYQDYEIIVVDDGSTDDTQVVLSKYRDVIRCLSQSNAGSSVARNVGAAVATGRYIAFLDADDRLAPDKLALQVPALENNKELALIASGLNLVDSIGHVQRIECPWLHQPCIDLERLTFVGLVGVHGTLLRRTWFDQVNGFDARLRYCQDMDLWWRILVAGGQMAWLTAVVGDYRIHEMNKSQSILEHHQWRIGLLHQQVSSGKLSATLMARVPGAIAQLKVAAAGRLYGIGDRTSAGTLMSEAIKLDPGLLDHGGTGLMDVMVCWKGDPWIRNRDSVLTTALAALPPELAWLSPQASRLETRYWRRQFYVAVAERQGALLRRAWLKVAWRDPSWLANRGSWSHLVRSIANPSQWRQTTPLVPEIIR